MAAGVIYLLTGAGHAARLVVSVWSLRRHFDGPVTVYTTRPESHRIGALIAADPRLRVEHRTFPESKVRRNSAFLTKLALLPHAPYEPCLHLDADTMVVGDVSELINVGEATPFHATQFAHWVSSGRTIRKRIERWRTIGQGRFPAAEWNGLVDDAQRTRPAVNGGVFAFRRSSSLLEPWAELAMIGRDTFICDEVALQILLHRHPHRVLDCRFNCSPVYKAGQPDPRVWHFHGDKHLGRAAGERLWLPAYRQCLRENVASIADWTPAGDERLFRHAATANDMQRAGLVV